MPAVDPTDLGYLRDQKPTARVEWFLAVAPYGAACFTAQVNNAAIERGTMLIDYDTDAGEGNVQAGMTLWVGSAAGLFDVGKVRIRSINAGADQIDVAENDDIAWADGLHLTCPGAYGFREIWGVYQRLEEAGGAGIFYIDYDILFAAPADTVLPPKANGGPPVCAWIDPVTGNADVEFGHGDRSYTTEIGATITYLWDFADGAVIAGNVAAAGTCAVPNVVRWNAPGFRYVSLTVTDDTAQARDQVHYVPVWIFEAGVEDPYTNIEVLSQDSSADSGWRARFRVRQTNTAAEDIIYSFPPGALVVLFTRTWYGDTEVGVGGMCYRESVRYVGWLDEESLDFNYETGTVEFTAVSHDGVLRRTPGFAFTLENVDAPTDWYEMNNLNVDRAAHYLLLYHTTACEVCHVERAGESNNRPLPIQAFPDAQIYSQIQEHLLTDARCLLLSDRQGILRITRDPQFMDAADRGGVAVVCTLSDADSDWMGDIEESKPLSPSVGCVRLGGFQYDTPLLSLAPGLAPLQQENEMPIEGLILQDQDEANRWSGQALAKANEEYKAVPIETAGYWPVFDPAHQEYVQLTITDPLSRKQWTNEKFIVRETSFRDDHLAGTCITEIVLERATEWLDGETQNPTTSPPPGDPEWPEPPGMQEPELWEGPIKACIAYNSKQLAWTEDALRHHVVSQGTGGTGGGGGLDLFDNTVDFSVLEIEVGDLVENLIDHAHTTVAVVVGPNQLTLAADIGLGDGDWYHIGQPEWVDIRGNIDTTPGGDDEIILCVDWVRTGENTVSAWALTDQNVWFTTNILTSSPGWTRKLSLATVQAMDPLLSVAEFRGIAVNRFPDFFAQYAIVSFNENGAGDATDPCYGTVFSGDCGASWELSQYPNACTPGGGGHGRCTVLCPYRAIVIEMFGDTIYHIRGGRYASGDYRMWVYISTDGGQMFCAATNEVMASHQPDTASDLYIGTYGGTLWATVRDPTDGAGGHGTAALLESPDGGMTWANADPGGYTKVIGLANGGGKTGVGGHYDDPSDRYAIYERTADVAHVLLRNDALIGIAGTDDPAAPIANECFDYVPAVFNGSVAVAPASWIPDALVLLWSGIATSDVIIHALNRRLFYTDNDGTHWCNKMGNWYSNPDFDNDGDTFSEWSGGGPLSSGGAGDVGFIPLPRVGANA